jgi:hypothetical protein
MNESRLWTCDGEGGRERGGIVRGAWGGAVTWAAGSGRAGACSTVVVVGEESIEDAVV